MLIRTEEKALFAAYRDGSLEAMHHLVESYLPFVGKIASLYCRSAGKSELFNDAVQAGVSGLIRAINKFEPKRDNKLSSYAIWWITEAVVEELGMLRFAVKAPVHQVAARLRRRERDGTNGTVHMPQEAMSLDASSGEDGDGATRLENLLDERANPEEAVLAKDFSLKFRGALAEALVCLSERERFIIIQRRLIDPPETLRTLSAVLGISAERTRQIEWIAFAKVRDLVLEQFPDISFS